ncbi:MAG: hypothetical protein LBI04_09200 [Treponema sp.]|nr:hypothetical protein [Treponema sp.]
MKSNVKKVMRFFIVGLLLFAAGFVCGRYFDRIRILGNQAGTAPDVRGYDAASERTERAKDAIEDAARNVSGAAGAVRIGVDEAGRITGIAGDVGFGIDRALDGTRGLADGIQRVMGIMDAAEKRNAKMEETGGGGMD